MKARQRIPVIAAAFCPWHMLLLSAAPNFNSPQGADAPLQSESAPDGFRAAATRGQFRYRGQTYQLFPDRLAVRPDLASPLRLEDGTEVMLCITTNRQVTLAPVTVENGAPLDYTRRPWGNGRQVDVDTNDFPTLAATGRHSEGELRQTKTITGRPISQITEQGHPDGLSDAGFLAQDEEILAVLIGDNHLVEAMGLTHRELARPLFHLWNLLLAQDETRQRQTAHCLRYHDKDVRVEWRGSRGWQESLFSDEIQGMYEFEAWREMDAEEKAVLDTQYAHLGALEKATLVTALSRFHSGEMVPYYIQRYGFYEGHTRYRADPIAITFIFGLRSLPELDRAFSGRLHEVLTRHFTGRIP